VKPTEKLLPPKTLIPSGIDAVIWFDCDKQECLRRALGRRIDGINNVIYHIQDNPPSIEKSPLCEVIDPIDDESESSSCLVDRWMAFDQTKNSLQDWLSQFGDESNKRCLLKRIQASGDINHVFKQIDLHLQEILTNKVTHQ
jgi:adenylate kinase family enzyme